jgi:sarcosine oxidase
MTGQARTSAMNSGYDVIVLGLGGMGSATVYELARRGRRVLGLEQFTPLHTLGSSHGKTRIIRRAYFEHPDYVPLLHRAYERWYDLEQLCGQHLLTECGCLGIGRPDSVLISGIRTSADMHGLKVEYLSRPDLGRRYPAFTLDEDVVGILEPGAGILAVERCISEYLDAARALGADLHFEEPVQSWEATAGGVSVQTAKQRYQADRLLITAGPWATRLLAEIGMPLTVMRQVPFWLATADDRRFRRDVFPAYIYETSEGHFYGFPVISPLGHKVARHYGAQELAEVDQIDRVVHAEDEEPVRSFLRRHLPSVNGSRRHAEVCIYTLTPDRHFVIDLHPSYRNVAVAAGFSGHGFKFASVVGEILADLAETGRTRLPIERFRISATR